MSYVRIELLFTTDSVQYIINLLEQKNYIIIVNKMMMTNNSDEFYEDKEALAEAYAEMFEAAEILEQAYKKVTPNECSGEQNHVIDDE